MQWSYRQQPTWWRPRASRFSQRAGLALSVIVGAALIAFGFYDEWALARTVNAALARNEIHMASGVVERLKNSGMNGQQFRLGDAYLYAHEGVLDPVPDFEDWQLKDGQLLRIQYVVFGATNVVTRVEGLAPFVCPSR